MPTGTVIREMREAEYPLLEDFLYEAIFIPEDFDGEIPRSIIREPELAAFIEGFGTLPDDHCLVAEVEGTAVGAAWARIVRTYGHIDDTTPLLSISLLPEHRGQGIGTVLMDRLLDHLRTLGHRRGIPVRAEGEPRPASVPALRFRRLSRGGRRAHHDQESGRRNLE